MPELPEVETVRRDLERELPGRAVREVRVHHADIVLDGTPAAFRRRLRGRVVRRVGRRGKYLLLELDDDLVLQVQLRMTGRFAIGRRLPRSAGFRHIAAELELDDGRTVYYDDTRRLGGFRLLRKEEWARLERGLGPEPLASGFTAARLAAALEGRRAPVKNVLLDQRRLAGVGNIYASEALHRAGIDPRRPAGELDRTEVARLHRAVRAVLRRALAASGTSFSHYRALNGRSGRYQESLRAYGRAGEPCPRCRGRIRRIVQAGRSTFFCPRCQR